VRPLPWLLRIGFFALGFAFGVLRDGANPVQQPIIIELQIVKSDPPQARVSQVHVFEATTQRP